MKRNFSKLLAALALLAFMAPSMVMWGQTTVTWPASTALPGTASPVANDQNITIMVSSTNTYTNPIRIYANTTVTINALNGAKILSVNYESSSTGNYVTNAQNASVTPEVTPTVNGKIVTWTYSESDNVTEFTFKPSAQTRSNGISITYTASGVTPTCATPTFSPAAGTYTSAQDVIISTTTEGATIYYTLDGIDPTTSSNVYSSPISITETTTVKAMATADGYSNSAVGTATYTITTPSTIAEVRAQGTGSVFTQGVVTSCVGTTGYIQDATAAICVYGTSLTVGDEITVSGTLSTYNGLLEITNPEVTVVSQNNTVEPTLKTIAEINADDYTSSNSIQGLYVTIEGATVTAISGQNTTIAQGDNTIIVRGISGVDYDVDDVLTLNGNIGCYNAAQIANPQNVEVQQNLVPSVTVTPATINAPFAGAEGTLALTYENIEDFISFDFYFCDAEGNELQEDPNWIDSEIQEENDSYSLYYLIDANDGEARTAYLKVYTFDDNLEEVYAIVTVSQARYVADYAELPFEFDGGRAAIANTNGLTYENLGSDYNSSPKLKFDQGNQNNNNTYSTLVLKFNERPGTLTFNIKGNSFSGGTFKVQTSEDGETYTDLETYTELTSTVLDESFDNLGENVRYIKWIYTQKVNGNVALGNITLAKYTEPVFVASITIDPALVELDAEEHDGTLDLTWENLEIEDIFNDFGIQFYDAEGEETLEPDWIEVFVAEQDPNEGEGYLVSYFMLENEGEARTAYFKVFALGDEDFVYSNLVTINQAAPVVPGTNGTITFGSAEGSTKINSTSVTGDDSMGNTWTITTVMNQTSFTQSSNYSQVGSSNNPATSITFTTTLPAEAIISAFEAKFGGFSNTAGDVTLLVDSETVGTGSLNASDDVIVQNTTTATGTVLTVTVTNIAKGVKCYYISYTLSTSETETYTLEITGYEEGSNGGYYLIASPVTVDPATVDGMTSGDFDLYYYDESNDNEWRNYEANAFNLEPGKGYLYAKQATTEGEVFNFTLTGTPYAGNGTVELDYNEDSEFPGFNLIGNPFGTNATLNMPYYRLNSDRSGLNTSTETTEINVMEGVFVEATAEIQTATFSTGAKRVNQLNIKVTRNRGTVLDNAIIRFDNGATLGKFQINQNSTKLYITEGNQDYAVVCSNNEGEMPVNFKAAGNGNYTLSVDAENVEVSYLHLIDNMNNADIDLLATPSYSFDARTTDNANRFRLVFNTNGVDENTTTASFAYFNGSEWTISNMGEATLQVVDMMGRVLSTQAISGTTEVSISQVPGVYMLRLINGENVMVQKVVVR
jgi:hypothetical protein